MSRRLAGVDVGGTFTDIALWDGTRGTVTVHKVLTTPDDPTRAILTGLSDLGVRVHEVIHGTTLVTNALIERRGAPTGLVTTEGYRDVIEIGDELRYDTFDLFLQRPEPLVPRRLRLGVRERVGARGEEVVPLDEEDVRAAGRLLVEAGVRAVAVAFFNAYRNPSHERRAAEILLEAYPGLTVCTACDVAPEIREYERVSTAVANAYVQPLAADYLLQLGEALEAPLFVILSDGGITTARDAARRPIAIVESGPAAGAMLAAHLSAARRWPEVITFDMGGTTAKISLVHGGVPERVHRIEVARVHRFKKGSGLPLRLPVVQLIEIGAGGGSIAWFDDLGLLKVGPRSSGAVPGPACYGLGGTEPTVTDADLLLGYLSPDGFLGGRMHLNRRRAEEAVADLARRLGLDPIQVALGIHEVVNNNMATAARVHISEQGRDPRRYRLLAFGGAGPVHAYGVARMLGVREVVIPQAAGVASAVGMLVAPRSVEFTRSLVSSVEAMDWDDVRRLVAELEERARGLLREAGADDARVEVCAEMRYAGQGYEVPVPVDLEVISQGDAVALLAAFEAEYLRRFGRSLAGMPAEVISWRVRALAPAEVAELRFESGAVRRRSGQRRPVYFREAGGFVETPVFDRSELVPGRVIHGPAIVEEAESTTVVGPAARLYAEGDGNLIMRLD